MTEKSQRTEAKGNDKVLSTRRRVLTRSNEPAVPVNIGRLSDTLISIVPGVIAHGAGHWYRGDIESGKKILLLEGISLATLIGAYTVDHLAQTSDTIPSAGVKWLYHVGGVLFVTTWLTDLIGSFRGDQQRRVSDKSRTPFRAATGYRYQDDPQRGLNHHIINQLTYAGRRWHGEVHFDWESQGKLAGLSAELDSWVYQYRDPRFHLPSGLRFGGTLKRWAWLQEDLIQWVASPFIEGDLSLELISSGLRSFTFTHRVGLGWERFDLSPVLGRQESATPLIDFPLSLRSGVNVRPSDLFEMEVAIIQDSTLDLRPMNEDHLFWTAMLSYQQTERVTLDATVMWGEDWSMWLLVSFKGGQGS